MAASGGGAAASGGPEFQAQVAAFFAAGMLAEQAFPPPWQLPTNSTIELVACEVAESVDDVELVFRGGGRALIQVKRTVGAQRSETSALAGALSQFVNAFIDARDRVDGRRPVDPDDDRLVLACGPDSVRAIRRALPTLLSRLRSAPPQRAVDVRQTNDDEREVWPIVIDHVTRAWRDRTASAPSDADLVRVLALVWVQPFDLEPDGADERDVLSRLRDVVLADPTQSSLAWSRLVALMLANAAGRRGIDRRALAARLSAEGLSLRAAPSVRDDIDRLRRETERTTAVLAPLSEIRLSSGTVKLTRTAAGQALERAQRGPCLLISEPGGGKTAVMHDVLDQLERDGRDVVALAADRFAVSDSAELSQGLGLSKRLVDVLADWPGADRGVLVVDALDAARGGEGPAVFVTLIEEVAALAPRWTVLASVRTFDLRYNDALQRAVGPPEPDELTNEGEHTDSQLARVRHLRVWPLTDAELDQLRDAAPDAHAFVRNAPPALRELVRNPFNLARLAELLDAGVPADQLRPLQTQLDLLEIYWQRRVRTPAAGAGGRERLLRAACERAVALLRLSMPRADVLVDEASDRAAEQLLREGVLIEADAPGGASDALAFSHHVLFDYAVARLLLRIDDDTLCQRMRAEPELALLARPSLTLHFLWRWQHDRDGFWALVFSLLGVERSRCWRAWSARRSQPTPRAPQTFSRCSTHSTTSPDPATRPPGRVCSI